MRFNTNHTNFKKMNRLNFTKFLFIVVLMLCPFAFYGQENDSISKKTNDYKTFEDYVYVSGDLGLGFLKGDNAKLKMDFNGHLGFGYQFDNILGIKANLGYGSLNGGFDNLSIDKMNYFEANLNLTVSLTDIIFGYNPERLVNFVPHIGLGQVQYKVRTVNNEGETLRNIEDRRTVATIPMGAEVNFRINNNWKVYMDFVANYADTDVLDGVYSGEHNDWFAAFNIGASYRLGDKANIFNRQHEFCNYWFLTADGGASFLFGDNKYELQSVRGNMYIGGGYNFHNYYRVYGKIGYGIYTGENPDFFTLDYADYYAANINISADLIGLIFGYDETRRIGLYPHIGIGQIQYRARTTFENGKKVQYGYDHDANTNTKGHGIADRKVVLTVPMGVEFTYNMNETYDVFVDVTTNYSDTDMLDCVYSGESKDYLNSFNVGLRYKFKNSCVRAQAKADEDCVTPEELKEALKEALAEQDAKRDNEEAQRAEEAAQRAEEAAAKATEAAAIAKETIYHNNFTNIVFPINESKKLDTQTNIDAINRAANEMRNGYEVERVLVEGFTSPDGLEDSNHNLAQERADAAAKLVKEHLEVDDQHLEIVSKGPDWEGLFNAIKGSEMSNKEEIIQKLNESSNREQTLRELIDQSQELHDLLPQLRRAAVTITTVKRNH